MYGERFDVFVKEVKHNAAEFQFSGVFGFSDATITKDKYGLNDKTLT